METSGNNDGQNDFRNQNGNVLYSRVVPASRGPAGRR